MRYAQSFDHSNIKHSVCFNFLRQSFSEKVCKMSSVSESHNFSTQYPSMALAIISSVANGRGEQRPTAPLHWQAEKGK